MKKKDQIVLGDRVELKWEDNPAYRSLVEDVAEDGRIFISSPIYKGETIMIPRGQEMEIGYFRPNGRYRVTARALERHASGQLILVSLAILTRPEKQQRRESFRLRKRIDVEVGHIPHESTLLGLPDMDSEDVEKRETVVTEDLSETGTGLKTAYEYEEGEALVLRLYLTSGKKTESVMTLFGMVQSAKYDEIKKTYFAGVKFLALTEADKRHLVKYIMREQQKMLLQERLVEGE